jgi:hypothetical protein
MQLHVPKSAWFLTSPTISKVDMSLRTLGFTTCQSPSKILPKKCSNNVATPENVSRNQETPTNKLVEFELKRECYKQRKTKKAAVKFFRLSPIKPLMTSY